MLTSLHGETSLHGLTCGKRVRASQAVEKIGQWQPPMRLNDTRTYFEKLATISQPSEAEATLDIRALPDEKIEQFQAQMARVINDPAVKIVPLPMTRPFSPASPLKNEMYQAIEKVGLAMYPATVLPSMSTGASDKAQLRAKRMPGYGIGPAASDEDGLKFGAHSDVERRLESSLYGFVEFTWRVVTEVAVKR